ncbi:MAG: sugar phosphate isomerase/epimerase [Promicromonosporaceae bacterium]|nr:sugar phosphate isomerase/epimerase [Promicromonosporaceae bacterium]
MSPRAAAARQAGFAYLEPGVGARLCPEEPDSAFAARQEEFARVGLPTPVCNLFLPGDMKVAGPAADAVRQRKFLEAAMPRAAQAGVRVIIFGSGGQRRVPEGLTAAGGRRALLAFARMAGDLAQAHGAVVAMEPLNRAETDLLTSVAETAAFVDEAGHPAVKMMVDAFHWSREGETEDAIARAGARIVHAHIGTTANRLAPGLEPFPAMEAFFRGLARAGFGGRVSVEAGLQDPAASLPKALEAMRAFAP